MYSLSLSSSLFLSPPFSNSDLLNALLTLSPCVYPCSTVQKHGAWRVVSTLQALLSSGSRESPEGRLAEETAEYHEKLAAALVCAED